MAATRLLKPRTPYPVDHPLWKRFCLYVETAGVIRRDLFQCEHDGDWEFVWEVFVAGAGMELETAVCQGKVPARYPSPQPVIPRTNP